MPSVASAEGIRTTCPYCGVGCGVIARRANGSIEVSGDPHHPANRGRLCSKGTSLGGTLAPDGRLLHPEVRGERVSWDRALKEVADGFARVLAEHGPEALAFYVSGQLLTEDYYVANKLMKGFLGGANIDTNSRLCMASAVAGHRRAFGEDLVPGCYEDLDLADLIVLVGANAAWCHPILFQRILAAKVERPALKLVVIDPRRTPTCELADLHLPVRPGTDVWLFNGLLGYLNRNGCTDTAFVAGNTRGLEAALAEADVAGDEQAVAAACGVDAARVKAFFAAFAGTERVVTAFSQGVNQSSSGTDKVNSIINCHLLTGRLGRPGMGPFSLTGQPNAMGGREVGGLANVLAAHMDIEDAEHRAIVQRHWRSPRLPAGPGLKAVELFEAIAAGRVRAVWIMATNPLVSLPDADQARAALECCELVVASDCVRDTDTNRLAHVLLPAAGWGEKDGTVTNSERRISRQRQFLDAPGEARPDWWIVTEVARRMGFAREFPYSSPQEIFDEHARLSAAGNDGARAFDIGGLAGLTPDQYATLEPVQWPLTRAGKAGTARLFEHGAFHHPDGKARFVRAVARPPAHGTSEEFPLILNTGRIRDQWHSMTRTGRCAPLTEHLPEPYVDVHAQDALALGLRVGALARISTRWGSMIARVRASGEIARGQAFVPMHWNSLYASQARVGALVNPVVDPISGEPEFKHTPARVEPFEVDWFGVLCARGDLASIDATWWSLARGEGCVRYELAGRGVPRDWPRWAATALGSESSPGAGEDYLEYLDEAAGNYRAAFLVGDRLEGCLYVSRRPELPSRLWLGSLFAKTGFDDADRTALLAGRPLGRAEDCGPLVCSCFKVGRHAIRTAIATHGLTSVREVGERVKAGTNCGSCVPEIRALLADGS